MARKVYVSSGMGRDESLYAVAEKDLIAALIWPWFLTALDDWGRAEANPHEIKASVFPDWPTVTRADVERALQLYADPELPDGPLVYLYEADGMRCVAVDEDNWRKYQTHIRWDRKGKAVSDYPPYAGASSTLPEHPGTSGKIPPSPSPSLSTPPTPPKLEVPLELEPLVILAGTVRSKTATWELKQTDVQMLGTLLERFPIGQVVTELGKFKTYALTRDYKKLARAFANWMSRVEPQKVPASTRPFDPPQEITEEEREASRLAAQSSFQQVKDIMAKGGLTPARGAP